LYLPIETVSPVMAERLSNRGVRTFQMATTSSKVNIPCADASRAGLYTCLASNGRETVSANATVRVEEKSNDVQGARCPRKRSEPSVMGSPADIYMWTESRMERPGVSVQLMCRAGGVPRPKITWFETVGFGNFQKRIPIKSDDERFMLLANGDLLVKKTPTDVPMSMYQCEAVNEFGSDVEGIMLLQIIDDTDAKQEETPSEKQEENVDVLDTVPPLSPLFESKMSA